MYSLKKITHSQIINIIILFYDITMPSTYPRHSAPKLFEKRS